MATIVLRAGKGSPLTNAEVDANFSNINDELVLKLPLSGGTLTGTLNVNFSNASYSTPVSYSNTAAGGGGYMVNLFASSIGSAVAGDALWSNGVGNVIISPNAAGKSLKLVGGAWTGSAGITIDGSNNVALSSGATIGGNTALHAGNYSSYNTFSGVVSASSGFQTVGYAVNTRNRIWSFGNADAYGVSYFQGTSGVGGTAGSDTIGVHMGTATSAGSQWTFNMVDSSFRSAGPILQAGNQVLHAGNYSSYALPRTGGTLVTDSYIDFGPNSTWGATLRVGGNGHGGTSRASVATTNGNLHLDSALAGGGIYLNWYGGTAGTYFGNGASAQVGRVDGSGNATFSGSVTALGATLTGNLSFGSMTGTWITSSSMADAIGWNASYGVYIGSNTLGYSSYLRGNGTFTNNAGTYNLLHAGNVSSYALPVMASGTITEFGQTISANYTVTSGKNALSAGPITVNDGVTVTVPDGCAWVIV